MITMIGGNIVSQPSDDSGIALSNHDNRPEIVRAAGGYRFDYIDRKIENNNVVSENRGYFCRKQRCIYILSSYEITCVAELYKA